LESSIEIPKPSLVSKAGYIFELDSPPIAIGRASRDFKPDLDLSELDPEFASSRRHCRIDAGRDGLTITALRTTNSTYVNGSELAAGAAHTLRNGDVIQFGFEGVELTYVGAGGSLPSSFFE
jgi:pSer/pThr/pTyr-binding forkhead associated (FHA) protein